MPPMPISNESDDVVFAVSGIREALVLRQKKRALAKAQWPTAITTS